MCGIAGIINLKRRLSSPELSAIAEKMASSMAYRGPDDSDVWIDSDGRIALSHRRLSIIDTSSTGRQPMQSLDQRFVISFNGEIYNYLEIREELSKQGIQFRTRTDTEVLMEALRMWGLEAFKLLDGMYALALFDKSTGDVLLARDPFGKKPLYFTQTGSVFAFASELEALACSLPGFNRDIDPEAIAEYLALQYVHAPRTIYKNCHKLKPGHWLKLSADGITKTGCHFEFVPNESSTNIRPDDPAQLNELTDELDVIIKRCVKRRMISDVPLGAFLSGGVDSSLVVATMAKGLGAQVKTFSIGFDGTSESEHVYARQVAEHLGTQHHEKMLAPDVLKLAELIGTVLDEPNADSSCLPTYLLSQFTREHVTVALSGDGGDEMFGGYGRYFSTLAEEERWLRSDPDLKAWTPGRAYFSSRIMIFPEADLAELLGSVPPQTHALLQDFKRRLDDPNIPLLARMRQADVNAYLPGAVLAKVDRMSMQHSLEARCPLLSIEVARFAEKLTTAQCYSPGQGKLVLKNLAARYMPLEWLTRPKMGFGLPMSIWGRSELLGALKRLALSSDGVSQEFLGRSNLQKFLAKQQQSFSTYQVWAVLILEIWLRSHYAIKPPQRESIWRRLFGRPSGNSIERTVSAQSGFETNPG